LASSYFVRHRVWRAFGGVFSYVLAVNTKGYDCVNNFFHKPIDCSSIWRECRPNPKPLGFVSSVVEKKKSDFVFRQGPW
jgi:hypothetical protein